MQCISSRHLTMPLRSIISPHLTLPKHENTRRFCTWPPLNFSRHGSAKPTQHLTARDQTIPYPDDTSNCLTSPWLNATIRTLALRYQNNASTNRNMTRPYATYATLPMQDSAIHCYTSPGPTLPMPWSTKRCYTLPNLYVILPDISLPLLNSATLERISPYPYFSKLELQINWFSIDSTLVRWMWLLVEAFFSFTDHGIINIWY